MAVKKMIIGVDGGSKESGIAVITENGIQEGLVIENDKVYDFIEEKYWSLAKDDWDFDFYISIEDITSYGQTMGDSTIQTIKFLGMLEWRLRQFGGSRITKLCLIPRWEVKQWVFLQFRTVVEPFVLAKIKRNAEKKKNVALEAGLEFNDRKQAPTFVYVDDRCIVAAMRKKWSIPPAKGKQKPMYGLKDHSWQALAIADYFRVRENVKL